MCNYFNVCFFYFITGDSNPAHTAQKKNILYGLIILTNNSTHQTSAFTSLVRKNRYAYPAVCAFVIAALSYPGLCVWYVCVAVAASVYFYQQHLLCSLAIMFDSFLKAFIGPFLSLTQKVEIRHLFVSKPLSCMSVRWRGEKVFFKKKKAKKKESEKER